MKTLSLFREFYRRSPLLTSLGMVQFALALLLTAGLWLDQRQVMGINVWIKPIKFYLSGGIFFLTLSWLLYYWQSVFPKGIRLVTWVVVVALTVENICITMQAARGTASHFNVNTAFDGIVFSIMGLFIALGTLAVVYAFILMFRKNPGLEPAYLWGIRLGVLLFLIGSVVGGVMAGMLSHNVGVPMGGDGLPLVNWSTKGGDLRIAHFVGLHALQVLPLAGFGITRIASARAVGYVALAAFGYTALTIGLWWQAMQGIPLVYLK